MKLSLLSLCLCFHAVVSDHCSTTTLALKSNKLVTDLLTAKQRLYFEIPEGTTVMKGSFPGSTDNSITVSAGSTATMSFYDGKIVISARHYVSGAPSTWSSPLALWTGAAGVATILSGNRDVDRAVLGTTAVLAASSLMNVALADHGSHCDDGVKIYFNLPNYVQDSEPTPSMNGRQFVAFFYAAKRAKVAQPFAVKGGTCSMGQCGGPSSAGPTGCQCDDVCADLGDCCSDYAKSCEKVGLSVLNRFESKFDGFSVFSGATGASAKSCAGRCGRPSPDGSCLCDDGCHLTQDCCTDKDVQCPAQDSLATACKCSGTKNPGLPNNQQGGAECTSDNANPAGKWCYTDKGVCADGQPSQSLATQDWSVLACNQAQAPNPNPGAPNPGACKCSPTLVNANGAGAADCASKDTDGPSPGQTLDAWCYTEPDVCTDGQKSGALPGKEYSYQACKGVTPPGGGGTAPVAPSTWTCAKNVYGVRDSCDCNCGAVDPDCSIPNIRVSNCLGGQICSAQGTCANAPNPGTGGGGGNTGVRGSSLGCTGPAAPGNQGPGSRRQLEFVPRIVGGDTVNPPYKQLHLVSLQRTSGFHFCGGSLVHDGTWVLTAAHCLQGAAYGQVPNQLGQIVLHRHDLRVPLNQEGATSVKAHRVYNNKQYNPADSSNDIALIKLASIANPNQPMTRAEVPQNMRDNIIKMDDGSFAKEDQQVTVAGWGALTQGGRSPPTAKQVTVQYITNAKCQRAGGTGPPNQYQNRITPDMLCAGQKNGAPGKDSCQGDSGGPLTTSCTINGKTRAVLVGVVSWGFGCALANLPGVYARVHNFIPWMTQVIGANPNSFNG